MPPIAIFSDLDGCLLNKTDYRFDAAIPLLVRIRNLDIPLVLASSKTESEMRRIAKEMHLADAPLICENGGVVFRSHTSSECDAKQVLGAERSDILRVLRGLSGQFRFVSFINMGLAGVMEATDLPAEKAAAALDRHCTEPLLWQDDEGKLPQFASALEAEGLTLTRGGRFWHVAGVCDKGSAMRWVLEHWMTDPPRLTIAIGDSPIDQGLLAQADYPIAIPWADGLAHVEINGDNARIAKMPGAAGWADSVGEVLALLDSRG